MHNEVRSYGNINHASNFEEVKVDIGNNEYVNKPVPIFSNKNDDTKTTLYSIRFHMKSGKSRDMFVDEFKGDTDIRNDLNSVQSIMKSIEKHLREYECWQSWNDIIPEQNFFVYDRAIEYIEVVTR